MCNSFIYMKCIVIAICINNTLTSVSNQQKHSVASSYINPQIILIWQLYNTENIYFEIDITEVWAEYFGYVANLLWDCL